MNPETISAKDLLMGILASSPIVKRYLYNKGKAYQTLLEEIMTYDYYNEDAEYPTQGKVITKRLGISAGKYKKWLQAIADDLEYLLRMESDILDLSQSYECCFSIQGFRDRVDSFNCRLAHIPKVGESINLPFLRFQFEHPHFYVERISHEITDRKHTILIFLNTNNLNRYTQWITEKNDFEDKQRYKRRMRQEELD